jgi:phage terminase large subunit
VTRSGRPSGDFGLSPEERELQLLDEIAALEAEEKALLATISSARFAEYRDAPTRFITEVLRGRLWRLQQIIADRLIELRRVVVTSCFASGKTWLAARIVIWWISTDPRAVAITTASVGRAVKGQLWGEIRLAAGARGLPGKFTPGLDEVYEPRPDLPAGLLPRNPEWYIGPGNFALGFSTGEPNRFAGWHAPRLLLVLDEAEGIPLDLWDVMEGQLATGDVAVLAIGNPDPDGEDEGFRRAAESSLWHHVAISAFDTPNLVAGDDGVNPFLVTGRWVGERRTEWGEDHPMWISKVLGQFPPTSAARNVIPLDWFNRAVDRPGPYRGTNVEPEGGLDIARFGSDFTALAIHQGPIVGFLDRIHGFDGTEVGDWTIERMDRFECSTLKGDSSGMGGPVLDYIRARRPGWHVADVNAGRAAQDSEHYVLVRDELWFGVRTRFEENRIVLLTATIGQNLLDLLKGELVPVTYRYRLGRIVVEPKDGWPAHTAEAKRRRRHSPDLADALCLSFYSPPEWEFLGTA